MSDQTHCKESNPVDSSQSNPCHDDTNNGDIPSSNAVDRSAIDSNVNNSLSIHEGAPDLEQEAEARGNANIKKATFSIATDADDDDDDVVAGVAVSISEAGKPGLRPCPSMSSNLNNYDLVSSDLVESPHTNGCPMMDEAWEALRRSNVYYKSRPVGTLAAMDPNADALNYNQVCL